MASRCHPLHCAVPPHVLTNVARHGNDRQRDWALRSLAADATVRQARVQNMAVRAGGPREVADALAATFHPARANRIISDARHGYDVAEARVVRRERDDPSTTRPPTRPTTAWETRSASSRSASGAIRSTTRACRCGASSTSARITTTPTGTAVG